MDLKLIQCKIHSPVILGMTTSDSSGQLPAKSRDFHIGGCVMIDISFPNALHVDIERITFRNYYTATVGLFVRNRGDPSEAWKLCLRSRTLMPYPHCELAAEDYCQLTITDFLFPLLNVSELRFVLRQPSQTWKEFKIEDIQIFRKAESMSQAEDGLSAWITEIGQGEKSESSPSGGGSLSGHDRQLKGIGSVADLSKYMQTLWALTEQAHAGQTKTMIGRYDVDGCYDINLLSYT